MLHRGLVVLALIACLYVLPAGAQPRLGDCQIGPGLGSTLLFPYFEVDLDNTAGVTTLISVANGFGSPAMARVVLWTDWGFPTLAFDIYLRSFEVVPINVRGLFDGNVPSTGMGADLSGFDFCDVLPPTHVNPVLTMDERGQLAADHMGQPGPVFVDCAGEFHDDGIVRGYITVDVVDECSGVEGMSATFTPASTSMAFPYFVDGGDSAGIAIIDNRLWGEAVYVDFVNNSAQGSEAVTLWADPSLFSGTDIFTFYGSLHDYDGRDDRVPLPYRWDQRFLDGGAFAGGANLIVFRDLGARPEFVECGSTPAWHPLPDNTATLQQDGSDLFVVGSGETFPVATQRVDISSFGIPYDFGWIQIDTSLILGSWVQPSLTASSLFSAGYNGAPVESVCTSMPPMRVGPPAPAAKVEPRPPGLDKKAAGVAARPARRSRNGG